MKGKTKKASVSWNAALVGLGLLGVASLGCQHLRTLPHSAYPVTPKTNVIDDYHGVKVVDPYRWLEDLDSSAVARWVKEQNRLTFSYLSRIPFREALRKRLEELWNYEKYGTPWKEGGRYFFFHNTGLQNQSVLYTMRRLDEKPRLLLDPNRFSKDGTVALTAVVPSPDGRYLAYGISEAGSDWQQWHVLDIETGRVLPDTIRWVKFSVASWTADSKGFYYSRFDAPPPDKELTMPNYYQKVYYHRLGTDQRQDRLVYQRPDQKEWGFDAQVTDDGHYLIITVTKGTDPRNLLFYKDLTQPDAPIVELIRNFEAEYEFIDNDGPIFWIRTDRDAPRGRIIAIDIRHPEPENWKEIIPQSRDTLLGVNVIANRFVVHYLHDVKSEVRFFDLSGKPLGRLELPGIGSVRGLTGKRTDTETFYTFTSFNQPGTVYHLDFRTGKSTVFRQPKLRFRPEDYVVEQVFYRSKDGTRIPMFLCHKKGLKKNGKIPTLLYGYGGFDISITPRFSVSALLWMEMGGLYAVANIRGGGEYGEEWHRAGMKLKKQNVFDDFIAAAEWLIRNGYTNPHRLGISGASNGGLLVGACMTQRPDLFAVALPAVGVMDMLRFNKFTIGWAWESDYGSPENPEEFKALYAYSPYHNLRPGVRYPATLITTADHDDRVVPAHSFKFAARLQECQAGDAPVLIRIETRAGHGAGKPTSKRIEEEADRLAFLAYQLHMHPKFPRSSP